MAKKEDDAIQDLLDPKKLLEQLRECETKQFTSAIDLLEQCEERHRRNEKKLSRLTIAASAGGALVGQEAVQEVGQIVGVIDGVVSGDADAISEAASGIGLNPAELGLQVGPNGEIVFPGLGGLGGGFGGVGNGGAGGQGAGSQNAEKAVPSTEEEESKEKEEKGRKEEKEEQEEESEEEEEESEEESEEEEESEDEEEEEEEEDEEEDEQEEQQEDEQEQEQEQDTPEPDPPSSDQSASIPSLPDNTQETELIDYFEEAAALAEMEEIEALFETPNLIEEIPAILRSRRPDTSEEIVGVAEPNNQPPPIVIDEIVEEAGEDVEVPASPLDDPMPPLAGIGIPEPGILSIFFILSLLNLRLRYRAS